jgi:hypothetical protein
MMTTMAVVTTTIKPRQRAGYRVIASTSGRLHQTDFEVHNSSIWIIFSVGAQCIAPLRHNLTFIEPARNFDAFALPGTAIAIRFNPNLR